MHGTILSPTTRIGGPSFRCWPMSSIALSSAVMPIASWIITSSRHRNPAAEPVAWYAATQWPLHPSVQPPSSPMGASLPRTVQRHSRGKGPASLGTLPVCGPQSRSSQHGGASAAQPDRLIREIPRRQTQASRPALQVLFQRKQSHGQLIHAAYRQYGYRLAEIADYLNVHYATVSRRLKQAEQTNA